MVRQWQKLYYKGRMSGSDKSLHRKDFVKSAEADGFKFAKKLAYKDQLQQTIKEFIEFEGPAFLEVIIDPDAGVYPMVGPGLSGTLSAVPVSDMAPPVACAIISKLL